MEMERVFTIALVTVLTLISALADAYGFAHAAEIWKQDRFHLDELARSLVGTTVGVSIYLYSLRFLMQLGVEEAELQILFWLGFTFVGVALLSGAIFTWSHIDKFVALIVLTGIGWLMFNNAV